MNKSNTYHFNFNFATNSNPVDELSNATHCLQKSIIRQFKNAVEKWGLDYDADQLTVAMAPSGTILASAPAKSNSSILAFVHRSNNECHHSLSSGLYEIEVVKKIPTLFFYNLNEGKIKIYLKPIEPGTAEFSTPLGNDMCRNASGSTHEFCQRFVACAAYDLFC